MRPCLCKPRQYTWETLAKYTWRPFLGHVLFEKFCAGAQTQTSHEESSWFVSSRPDVAIGAPRCSSVRLCAEIMCGLAEGEVP